jgi:hypothetical protein
MAKDALIVGPPRSGTSLASSILARVGHHVGRISSPRERMGDDHNPFGYFEADEVVGANARLLERAGYPYHNTWTFDPISRAAAASIGDLDPADADRDLVDRYRDHSPWLWKDPRLCFTLEYWWQLVDHETTVVCLTTRDPADAYSSFRRKGWCRGGAGERRRVTGLVEQHAASAKEILTNLEIPHVTVDYAEYATHPGVVARRLGCAFRVDIAPCDLNFKPELDHSRWRGLISTHIRRQLKRLPREQVERIADLVPTRLLALLFPERVHARRMGRRDEDEARA